MTEVGTVDILCSKSFEVQRQPYKHNNKNIYQGPVDGIARWFYDNYPSSLDNVTIIIMGDIHSTYGLPGPHLSVSFRYYEQNGTFNTTPTIHLTYVWYNTWQQQQINQYNDYYGGDGIISSCNGRKQTKKRKKGYRKKKL